LLLAGMRVSLPRSALIDLRCCPQAFLSSTRPEEESGAEQPEAGTKISCLYLN